MTPQLYAETIDSCPFEYIPASDKTSHHAVRIWYYIKNPYIAHGLGYTKVQSGYGTTSRPPT